MPFGIVPARGTWEQRWFKNDSAATFPRGALVNLGADNEVEEYASTDSQILGVAVSHSTASLFGNWAGSGQTSGVAVYIPTPGCTAFADVITSFAQSDLSVGKKVGFAKSGNFMSFVSDVGSRFSQLATIVGPIQTDTSQVEVAFNIETGIVYSMSTATYAT